MSTEVAAGLFPRLIPHFTTKAWLHAFSTLLAAMLALYVSFEFELESPGSSVVTVLIVSSPLPGMVLSKGIWRIIGTLVGLVISVVLIAAFAQSPLAFILSLAIWLGICTYVSSLLRHFRAYAAVLAGYTISLVALPAADNPDLIFDLATGRIAVVVIGILCTALVKSMLVLDIGSHRLKPALEGAFTATAGFAAQALDLTPGLPERRRAVANQLASLDGLILAAANESAETAQQAPAVRLFVSILLGLVTLASSVRDALAHTPSDGPVAVAITPLRDMVRDLLIGLCGTEAFLSPTTGEALVASRRAAKELSDKLTLSCAPDTLDVLALAARLEDIVEQLQSARSHLQGILQGRTGRAVTPVSYHRDQQAAVINGLRAGIATLIAGGFWIITAWPSGTQMLGAVLPVCALLGTSDYPVPASAAFARGIALGGLLAVPCSYVLLTHIDGFPLLVAVLAPFIIGGCLYATIPKHAGSATAFLIFFTTFVNLHNPMSYDLSATLNMVSAFVLGAMFAVLVFQTLWPANTARAIRRLRHQMQRDVRNLAKRAPASPVIWETVMQDRLSRLSGRLSTSPYRSAVVEDGIAAVHIGREMMHAHWALDSLPLPADLARRVAATWDALRGGPDRAIEASQATALQLLAAADTQAPDRTGLLRAAGAFHEIALLMARHRAFFLSEPLTVEEPA
jgi:uncharacterized membrane protein YccC